MQQRQSFRSGLGRPSSRHERGFTFIEILVVMGIITVLMSMVVVVIPMMNERSSRTKSQDNLRNLSMFFQARAAGASSAKWPSYDGKNFTLAPITFGDLSAKNRETLGVFLSPGDVKYTVETVNFDRYKQITKDALKNDEDFHELTSYAGRRNKHEDFRLTANRIQEGAIILCDDDDGELHHAKGLCVAYGAGGVGFVEWPDFGMPEPDDPDNPERFLADEAPNDQLRALSSSH